MVSVVDAGVVDLVVAVVLLKVDALTILPFREVDFDDFHHRAVLVFDGVGLTKTADFETVDLVDCLDQGADFPACQHFVVFDFGDDEHRSKVTELQSLSMFFSFTYLLGNRGAKISVTSFALG